MSQYKCVLWCPAQGELESEEETRFEMSTARLWSMEYSASQMYKTVSKGLGNQVLIDTAKMEVLSFQEQIS